MAKEEEKKQEEPPKEDRDYWLRLRNEQRGIVRKELQKETLEVERRIEEEKRKLEEEIAKTEDFRNKRKRKWRMFIAIIIILITSFVLFYLYKMGYLKDLLAIFTS